jgi:hypothetical protein
MPSESGNLDLQLGPPWSSILSGRRIKSHANPSLAKFPANRKKTGNVPLSTGALRRYLHSRDYFAQGYDLPARDQNRECAGNANSLLRGLWRFDINCLHRNPRVIQSSMPGLLILNQWPRLAENYGILSIQSDSCLIVYCRLVELW